MARFDPDLSGRFLGNDMPIQGSFAFLDWEPRFGGRAELYLMADTPEHGLLLAALIVGCVKSSLCGYGVQKLD